MVSKSENDLPKSENDLPTMMAQLANERKQNGMDIQFPVKNILQKHIQKHTTPVIISMETSLPFPLIFPFLPMDSGSFSGPGGGTQARNWPMLSSKRFIDAKDCTLHALMADCQLQWKGFSHHFNPVRRSKFSWICLDGLVAEVATLFRGIVELLPASCLANKQ